jgi:hypothetical protein
VGLVFPREAVRDLLGSRHYFIEQLPFHQPKKKCVDGLVCNVLRAHGWTEYVHYPSLLQHVGQVSILGHCYGKMAAYEPGFDPLSMLKTEEELCGPS